MISSMSKPGTFKEAPTEGELCSAVTSLVTEKERKKIDKEVQQQIKQEALFNAKQEALLNAKKKSSISVRLCSTNTLSLMCCSGNQFEVLDNLRPPPYNPFYY